MPSAEAPSLAVAATEGQAPVSATPRRRRGLVGETWFPSRSGHDLDALGVGRGAPTLALENLAQSADRDLELIEGRLPRGQPLEPQAGRQERHQDAVAGVLAREPDQL